jgi:galactosylceramidase
MHDPWTADFNRGYEWFLIEQAKARNPDIKLYGLPWAFPQWVSCNPGTLTNCTDNPYDRPEQTAAYITSWVNGAKTVYNQSIDYIGSWNVRCRGARFSVSLWYCVPFPLLRRTQERNYDMTYIETLRGSLDAAGFSDTKIIVADSSFSVANDIVAHPDFAKAV